MIIYIKLPAVQSQLPLVSALLLRVFLLPLSSQISSGCNAFRQRGMQIRIHAPGLEQVRWLALAVVEENDIAAVFCHDGLLLQGPDGSDAIVAVRQDFRETIGGDELRESCQHIYE